MKVIYRRGLALKVARMVVQNAADFEPSNASRLRIACRAMDDFCEEFQGEVQGAVRSLLGLPANQVIVPSDELEEGEPPHLAADSLLTPFAVEVRKELDAMADVGMRVPSGAYALLEDGPKMRGYENMGVGDCASLLVQLGGLR